MQATLTKLAASRPSSPTDVLPVFAGENNDAAKHEHYLIDIISINGHIAASLSDFATRYLDQLPKCAVSELE